MRNLNDTVARLTRMKRLGGLQGTDVPHHLSRLPKFGSNPGNLRAWEYVPADLPSGAPLVVVLHGCTQTAGAYDESAGWSRLADRFGFALLYPEQKQANNPNLCFNWFLQGDATRGHGEALSIRNMVETMIARHRLDSARIYVTGLSAGGAMAAVVLATYPDLFAAGAVIAGLPYGVATNVPQAFDLMRGHDLPSGDKLSAIARAAGGNAAPVPRLSVWHGTADHTVAPANADALIEQWKGLHHLAGPGETKTIGSHRRRRWRDADGRLVIEEYLIGGLGHGTPLDPSDASLSERSGPHMLDAGISSTYLISEFWGIVPKRRKADRSSHAPTTPSPDADHQRNDLGDFIEGTIEGALRTAGLIR
ncbi:PHB depolymerase family esterase [Sphingomonas piscis]|uniref:PHB depolymerase family esterase n=1 Tax=Sphingomonas piscis TaxID=2714943 RepID=A0A6G7YSL9_9SPHN|nr:PHB depolymerase family esterase [Sphingomonas piscis]QIK79721.1 PHB depolymerase family esterase [Sphingomonas piscis]